MSGLDQIFVLRELTSFPGDFLVEVATSVLYDLSHGSPGMDPVWSLMETDGGIAMAFSRGLARMQEKPVIRCENCAKNPQEVDGSPKFMVCARCKGDLDYKVHYCSRFVFLIVTLGLSFAFSN